MVEADWQAFRARHFPDQDINLNPGALGTTCRPARAAIRSFRRKWSANPIAQYRAARSSLKAARALALRIWGDGYRVALGGGTTATMNLVVMAVASRMDQRPIDILSTAHEHAGGLSGFVRHPAYRVHLLTSEEVQDQEAFARRASTVKPDLAFFSQRTWTRGRRLPLERWIPTLRNVAPGCRVLIDAAQAVGVEPALLPGADAIVASAHKWLFAPPGTGFLWLTPDMADWLGPLTWCGSSLDAESDTAAFESAGGQAFATIAGLEASLELYEENHQQVQQRSEALASEFAAQLQAVLQAHRLPFGCELAGPVLTVDFPTLDPYPLYLRLGERGVHVKCIKASLQDGERLDVLRFGLPYYETRDRLCQALERIDHELRRCHPRNG
ncbi:MAG: aminotransferase class V-fold PLP-dependent enzyme [Myxococcales bacterium]|nr:aminotransferase class V-fold PLP-dependent enzyme [Myxococcales bacterium]